MWRVSVVCAIVIMVLSSSPVTAQAPDSRLTDLSAAIDAHSDTHFIRPLNDGKIGLVYDSEVDQKYGASYDTFDKSGSLLSHTFVEGMMGGEPTFVVAPNGYVHILCGGEHLFAAALDAKGKLVSKATMIKEVRIGMPFLAAISGDTIIGIGPQPIIAPHSLLS